jgi:hypothetical protein
MPPRALALGLTIGALTAGCGDEVERDPYVRANRALLDSVPRFPGAQLTQVSSSGYQANEQTQVMRFYRRTLRRGWRLVDVAAAPSLSLQKGDAYLHILAGGGVIDVEGDHDCYKGGSSPTCFGP